MGTMRLTIKEILDSAGLISTIPGTIPIEGGWGIRCPGSDRRVRAYLLARARFTPSRVIDIAWGPRLRR